MCGWDASPTWSGYLYQGKVAIYHMLKVICERLEKDEKCPKEGAGKCQNVNIPAECCNYTMELEQIEDFSIKDKSDKYYTVHQVKAYKSQESSQYTKAIAKLVENVKKFSTGSFVPKGYLHVIKEVPITYDDPNLLTYEYFINGKKQKYCGLDEIEQLIKEKIAQLKNSLISEKLSERDTDVIYLFYMNVIDQIVRERHKNIDIYGRDNFKVEPYPFCFLCELLDTIKEDRDLYYVNKLKNKFVERFEEYYYELLELTKKCMEEQTIEEIAALSDETSKLHKYMSELWNYYSINENFKSFCKMITPDYISNEKLNDDDYRALIPDKSLDEFYFPTTEKLVNSMAEAKSNGVFIIEQKKHIVTNITTPISKNSSNKKVNEIYKKQQETKLRKMILDNPSNVELLFEIDTLVSKEIDLVKIYDDSFYDLSNTYINQLEQESTSDRNLHSKVYDSIVHIKENIEIISLEKLEERLCGI